MMRKKMRKLLLMIVIAVMTVGISLGLQQKVKAEDTTKLSNLKVVDYYKYSGKYFLYFTEETEASEYRVYVDGKYIKTIYKNGQYIKADEIAGIAYGTHTLKLSSYKDDGVSSADDNSQFISSVSGSINVDNAPGDYNDIAQVYIYSKNTVNYNYHDNADVTISVVDKNGSKKEDIIDSQSNIKIRGNSTSTSIKKPYNIKLSGKKSLLGMDKGKKWCLLANQFDKSLMRNKLALELADDMGLSYTSNSQYVELYLNGKYCGNYLLTEPVEAKSTRVDIDAYNPDSLDILLEYGTRNESDVVHFSTKYYGTTYDVNDPEKGGDLTDQQIESKVDNVKNFLYDFELALHNRNYEEALKYMDEKSFVDFYVLNELFKNVDFNFSSTRFYIKDNKIYAGPVWDLDLSSGNANSSYYTGYYNDGVSYKGFYCTSQTWYNKLTQMAGFNDKVKARYAELQYIIQNIYSEDSKTSTSIDYLQANYGASFERNYISTSLLGAGWSLTNWDDGADAYSYSKESGWTSYSQPVEHLRTWLKNRNEYLCNYWNIDISKAYEESDPDQIKASISIEGCQISVAKEGFRTLYAVEDDRGQVTRTGLIYALSEDVQDEEMVLGGSSKLYTYLTTEKGLVDEYYSDNAKLYAMTMLNIKTAYFYKAKLKIRAFALVGNGKIIYSDIEEISVFGVAERLYSCKQMPTVAEHNYLFKNIISLVDKKYPYTPYN